MNMKPILHGLIALFAIGFALAPLRADQVQPASPFILGYPSRLSLLPSEEL